MKRFFNVNGQVLIVQSTHDNAVIEAPEVAEADYLAFVADQEKKRADVDDAAYLANNKAHKEKLTQAQGIYDEAVKLGFTASSAEAIAKGAYAGWRMVDNLSTLPSIGQATQSKLNALGINSYSDVASMTIDQWISAGGKASNYQPVVEAAQQQALLQAARQKSILPTS